MCYARNNKNVFNFSSISMIQLGIQGEISSLSHLLFLVYLKKKKNEGLIGKEKPSLSLAKCLLKDNTVV